MSTDVFRRVGRGGAGNFYSKKDIQDAEKASTAVTVTHSPTQPNPPPLTRPFEKQDIEAQTPSTPVTLIRTQTHSSTTGSASVPSYTRAGRGGAGNFTFPDPNAAESASSNPLKDEEDAEAERTRAAAAVAASVAAKSRAGGLSGRGGAGNWTGGSGSDGDERKEEAEEELELRVLREVEVGLAMPQRAYHAPGQGGGR